MNILILTAWYPTRRHPIFGSFIVEQAEALAKHHNVTLLAVQRNIFPKHKTFYSNKVQTIKIGNPLLNTSKINKLNKWINLACSNIKKIIKNHNIDIIHLHDILPISAAQSIYQVSQIPLVATIHQSRIISNTLPQYYERYLKNGLKYCNHIICVGNNLKNKVSTLANPSKIRVIPNLVQIDKFVMQPKKLLPFKFIIIGSLIERKRIPDVVEQFAKCNLSHTQLHICGNGKQRKTIEKMIKSLSLIDRVFLYGNVARAQLPKIVSSCHVLISNSTFETFGITLYEAMSSGLPILYSNSGIENNFPEYVGINYQNQQLHIAMQKIFETYQQYDLHKIRKFVVNKCSSPIIVQKLENIYKEKTYTHEFTSNRNSS